MHRKIFTTNQVMFIKVILVKMIYGTPYDMYIHIYIYISIGSVTVTFIIIIQYLERQTTKIYLKRITTTSSSAVSVTLCCMFYQSIQVLHSINVKGKEAVQQNLGVVFPKFYTGGGGRIAVIFW